MKKDFSITFVCFVYMFLTSTTQFFSDTSNELYHSTWFVTEINPFVRFIRRYE